MPKVSKKTIERYVSLWNKLQTSGVRLDTLDKLTFNEFKNKTNINSESQFRLAKALARNIERQKEVNQYLNKKAIPKTIIKRTPEVQAIPIVKKVKVKPKVVIAKKPRIPFEKTKFGKITKTVQKNLGLTEREAILKTRDLLKVPKRDYRKLKRIERDILVHYGY